MWKPPLAKSVIRGVMYIPGTICFHGPAVLRCRLGAACGKCGFCANPAKGFRAQQIVPLVTYTASSWRSWKHLVQDTTSYVSTLIICKNNIAKASGVHFVPQKKR